MDGDIESIKRARTKLGTLASDTHLITKEERSSTLETHSSLTFVENNGPRLVTMNTWSENRGCAFMIVSARVGLALSALPQLSESLRSRLQLIRIRKKVLSHFPNNGKWSQD